MDDRVTSILVAGLGGQGVLTATDIIADAAFRLGQDVKKSEIHGMSQRNGSVTSDIRVASEVFSPMIPKGEADVLLSVAEDQTDLHRHMVREGGVVITPACLGSVKLPHLKTLNIALLGVLSTHLEWPENLWIEAIMNRFPEKLHDINLQAFALGRKEAASA